jgi:hypothetical protein
MMATRAVEKVTATMWAIVTATRVVGNKEGNVDSASVMATQQGWRMSNSNEGNEEGNGNDMGNGNGNKVGG